MAYRPVWYGFVESIDEVEGRRTATLDLVRDGESVLEAPLRVLNVTQEASESMGSSLPALGQVEEGEWLRLQLARFDRRLPAELYSDEARMATRVSVGEIGRPGDDVVARLRSPSLELASPQSRETVDSVLASLVRRGRALVMYDVGQGNALALCDDSRRPLVFFDLGGGCFRNAHTYSPALFESRIDTSRLEAVVLSHWDFDHYLGAKTFPWARALTWIAPDQTTGPTGQRVRAGILAAGGRILPFPAGMIVDVPGSPCSLHLVRASGPARNHDGIVTRVQLGVRAALLPGDASYDKFGAAFKNAVEVLVAAHHGAARGIASPPSAPGGGGTVAFSYGANNTYLHPIPSTRAACAAAGWGAVVESPTGDAVLLT